MVLSFFFFKNYWVFFNYFYFDIDYEINDLLYVMCIYKIVM